MPYVEYDEVEAICSDCGRIFRSEEALEAHRAESHTGRTEPAATPHRSSGIRCPVCGQPFATPATLRVHLARAHRSSQEVPAR